MTLKFLVTTMALSAAIAVPAAAQDGERHRTKDNQQQAQGERAVPRGEGRRTNDQPAAQPQVPERAQPQRQEPAQQPQAQPQRQQLTQRPEAAQRQEQAQPRANDQRRAEQNRSYENNRGSENRGYQTRGNDNRGYNGSYNYSGNRNYNIRSYDNHAYAARHVAPRIIRPQVVRVVPYRPYVYRPSYSIGVFYGSDGYYPYGYTPRSYYEPIPGRAYGGVRVTGAPRDAQVFADGYYVGIVDDFDGIFQHINLEAGPHHVEVFWGGYEPIAFDVYVRPGETTTFRADGYFRY